MTATQTTSAAPKSSSPKSATNPRLNGFLFGNWLRLLRDNGFEVDRKYWPQALRITAMSLVNSPVSMLESLAYGSRVEAIKPQAPVFLLGHWRSGTTFFHRLLSMDDRFASPNTWECFHPHTFLVSEWLGTKIFDFSGKRDVDNVERSWWLPMEEDWGLGMMSLSSTIPTIAFPRNLDYERYVTLRDATPDELSRFKRALELFIKKLAFKYGKPALLKSPAHTGRIRHLLDVFPDAKFVHIRRNPYDLFQSMRKWMKTMAVNWYLQEPAYDIDEKILERYALLYDAFFDDIPRIPKGQFHEIAYEDLEREPLAKLRETYEAVSLGGFEAVKPKFQAHLDQRADYQKNSHVSLPEELRARISKRWKREFDAWNYEA